VRFLITYVSELVRDVGLFLNLEVVLCFIQTRHRKTWKWIVQCVV